MRKRRKTRYTWLPNLGTEFGDQPDRSSRYIQLAPNPSGAVIIGCVPLTFDTPQENAGVIPSVGLNDLVGNEYFLRRIVGKCLVNFTAATGVEINDIKPCTVAAAFFVARAESEATSALLPLAWSATAVQNYNPLGADCIREPWIWRRVWRLGFLGTIAPQVRSLLNQEQLDPTGGIFTSAGTWPPNNLAGSVADGPHIDAKCARRVGQDDRLWFTVAAQMDGGGSATNLYGVDVELDYRLLGALRKAKNSGNF